MGYLEPSFMGAGAIIRIAPHHKLGRIERIVSYVQNRVPDNMFDAVRPVLRAVDAEQLLATIMFT